jgi:flagellar biosynthetic protein FliR
VIDSLSIFLLSGKFIIGVLFFIRITGIFIAAPMLKAKTIPMQMKVILAIIISLSLTSAFWKDQPVIDFDLWFLVLLVFKELFVGFAIGFAVNFVFFSARFAGGLLDFDIGYQTSAMFMSEDTPSLLGEIYEMTILMIFFAINGHFFIFDALFHSVKAIPLGSFEMTKPVITQLLDMVAEFMIIGIKMAGPGLVSLFITNLALSLLARVAPQANIFSLSFQIKVAVGLIVLMFSTPLFVMVSKNALHQFEPQILNLIIKLNPIR